MDLILILKTVILGIVEGITEWLPISSTGHLILVDEFINLNVSAAFKEMFDVVIQLGAIMAVVVLYFHKLNPLSPKKNRKQKHETMVLWYKVIFAVLPAAVIGILFDDAIHDRFFNPVVVAATLIIYGVLFIVIENHNERSRRRGMDSLSGLTYRMAFIIGVFQVLSLIPGTSRSGATIVGGILIGCSRTVSAEFSFFLAIPVMLGASGLKLIKYADLLVGPQLLTLLVGTVVAFVVSLFAIRFLMKFIQTHTFKPFGYYRIVLGVAVLLYFYVLA